MIATKIVFPCVVESKKQKSIFCLFLTWQPFNMDNFISKYRNDTISYAQKRIEEF